MSSPLPSSTVSTPFSAWAPLRHATFRCLWLAWMASNMAMWMHDVAAAWFMATLTADPLWVALVQSAATAPVFLFGLVSGALADLVNRRTYLICTQLWLALVTCVLTATAALGALGPVSLLALAFASGIGLSMRWPVYSAIVPEVVPRAELGMAMALNGVAMNLSRIVGPVAAGLLMAWAGPTAVFAVNAIMALTAATLILQWRPERAQRSQERPRLWGSVCEGVVYIRRSGPMRAVLVRTVAFFFQASALMALLPMVARNLVPGSATGFTLLLSAMGAGAILITLILPRFRQTFSRDRVMTAGMLALAAATAATAFAPGLPWALPAMAVAGAAWLVSANSLALTAQLLLPNWVRARGMAIYQMVMMGSMSAGAAGWGAVANLTSIRASLYTAALVMIVLAWACRGAVLEDGTEAGVC